VAPEAGTIASGKGLWAVALRVRVAVDDDVAEEREQLGGAVTARLEREQFRRGVDERRGGLARLKLRVGDDVLEKWDVRLDAADTEFAQHALGAPHRNVVGLSAGDALHEHRVVEGVITAPA
jgi:hypothetical protein